MNRLTLPVIIGLAIILASCSSSAVLYLGHRISPNLPEEKGEQTVAVDGLAAPATVWLDEYGVPHIRAESEEALYFAYGYMQGRDRRFQIELLKFLAAGRLRELIGDRIEEGVFTRLEIFNRMIGFYLMAEEMLSALPDEDRAMLDAFAAGINAATEREPTPIEFRLLDHAPEPWTTFDSGMLMAMMSFGLSKNWELELGRLELIVHQLRTGSTIERALEIWKPRYNLPPHLIGRAPETDPFADIPVIAPELAEYLIEYVKSLQSEASRSPSGIKDPVESTTMLPPFFQGGSNNWAMTGDWTGTGRAALSSDPHLPHTMPPIGYLAHLHCDGCEGGAYEVIGAAFVGMPAVPIGTNGTVAWGVTSNWADAIDLYVERPAPGAPGHYMTPDGSAPFEVREEVFKIRGDDGSFRTEKRTARSTAHGVLVNDFVDRLPEDFPLVAMKREFNQGVPIRALRNLYRAGDVTEGRTALHDMTALISHWVLADAGGNVGYVGTVSLPKRRHHLGTLPAPGWVAKYDWKEFFTVAELPWIENPPDGFVGTANNQVIQPESFGHPINCEGDIPHRYARISRVLSAGSDGRPPVEQIASLQRDGVDMGFIQLRPLYEEILGPLRSSSDPLVSGAARALLGWDGDCRPDSPAPTIFQALNVQLVVATMQDEVSHETMHFVRTYFNIEPLVYSILGDPANPAWDDRRTERRESAGQVIPWAFRRAVAELAEAYGGDVTKWRWADAAPFHLEHPFGDIRMLAGYLNRGPIPATGTGNTVFKQQFTREQETRFPILHGPVLRTCVDLADLAGSRMSLPGGQSGRPSSPHYDDLLPLYLEGKGISMEMDWDRIAGRAEGTISFVPVE